MSAVPRILMLFIIVVSSLEGVALAGPEGAPSADDRELEVARDLLHQARRLLDSQYQARSTSRSRYTDGVAAALAEVGDHDAAEATFRHRQAFGFTDAALHELAVGYARGGDMLRVRKAVARIQDVGPGEFKQKPWAWLHVGQALAGSGRKEWAAEAFAAAISSMPNTSASSSLDGDLLEEVAEGQHGLGLANRSSAALEIAVSRVLNDPDKTMRVISLKKIAATQARLGFLPQALATADLIDKQEDRWWAWFVIVDAEAQAGRLNEAYRIAERVKGSAVPKTWVAIAAAESKAGHSPEAKRAQEKAEAGVNRIAETWYRIDMILLLAESRAAFGDRDAAAKWLEQAMAIAEGNVVVENRRSAILNQVERVPGAVDRQFNLRKIAACQAKLGLMDAAKRTFERAKVAARGERPGMWQNSALNVVAESQAEAGMPEEAMQTLAELPQSARGWLAYVPVAKAKARAGDLDGALRVAELHPGNALTTRGYIAEALLKAGDPGNALRIALRSAQMEEVLHDAARRLAASGEVTRVTDAVPHAYVEDRVALLLGAAEGLLDRARGPAKGVVIDPAKPAR